ncbi:HD-GYP domain-containing protein [Anoxynatronum buryatiense]|uniref:HD-GYP domain, c-di-GMP phosphodiesterase class II (Or its inactivated variant) n=1 Tax=Anoxynatronum buryatiense TaxID=489973 RepID=A0AA46AK69_9CLOT|nr:HD-GYP domain-containing protein [Anoxynatronum buryatiense]SMP67904.1 HD-GYP domain, c-di-GMP phosphodiesterase class II (or its inactivated variant) [Anoxynatronum buryatiense]
MSEIVYVTSKNIFLEELKQGMMIDQDVYSAQGMVLLPRGHILDEIDRVKHVLTTHGIMMLKVRIPEEIAGTEVETHRPPKQETLQERQAKVFLETIDEKCDRLKMEFQRMMMDGEVNKETLGERLDETLTAFDADINVMQLMQKVRDLDDSTYVHSHNVALTSHLIGRWMELPDDQLKELTQTALFIDIGKMKVDSEIMQKKGVFSELEFAEARKHAQYSYEAIKDYHFLSHQVAMGVLHHHERMDGSGYPMGLKGEDIPFYARIVAVADVYNALTSKRPHRDKMTPFEAIRIMETEFNELLDPKVLYLFLNRIGTLFTGQRIILQDGRTGEIIFVPRQNIHRPMVRMDDSEEVVDLNQNEYRHLQIRDFV